MKKLFLLFLILSACTNEEAYEALHPMKSKVVGTNVHCYWQSGYSTFIMGLNGHVIPVWVDGHDVCQNQQIKICTQ